MSVYSRLKRDDWLLRMQSFPYLFRDTKEAIVGQMTPSTWR